MASTVKPTNFLVKIKEEHVIGNQRTVNENFYRIPSVTNLDRRIVTVPNTTSVDLINTNGLVPGAGTFPSSSIKYGRITNMDDSASLAVSFTSSGGTPSYWTMDVLPTSSIMFSGVGVSGSDFIGSFSQDIEFISVFAISASIDVEYVIVNA
jgi:hypothetical protein